jgi:hypothetical protein
VSPWLDKRIKTMNKRILYTNADGGVSVIVPAPDAQLEGETENDFLARVAAGAVPEGVPFSIVDVSEVPADRTFRNAWRKSGATVTHDMPAAKAIAHEKRRAARAAELAPLDIEATIPAQAAQAEAARQAIREKYAAMQVEIDAADGVPDLKTAIAGLPS